MVRSVCSDLASQHLHALMPVIFFLSAITRSQSPLIPIKLAYMMSSSTASAPSRVVAARRNSSADVAGFTWRIEQIGSLPTSLSSNVQRFLTTIQHLLRTNDAPSSQDTVIVSEFGRLFFDQISRFDPATDTFALATIPHSSATPSNQSASIDEQKTLRDHLQRLQERVCSITSAVRRIPPEIWEEVFLFVRAHKSQVDVFNPLDPIHVVGQVCQQWRRASHFYPWLWSSILVVVPILRGISHHNVCRLREVLECSRGLPLEFVFRCNLAFSEDLLSLLMEHSWRWRSAEFSVITTDNALLLQSVRGRVPQLEALTLHVERGGFDRRDKISAFEIAPSSRGWICVISGLSRSCWIRA
ncbi:hypothetical protein CPB85DRAFT_482695 [Mucidula mucida]|nr:hypothetical protein CPB85DRAFT_482695 [Mucidula mucida]